VTGNKRPGVILQDRDRRLLRELLMLRVIDREQAEVVAGFGSITRANARLLALTRAGLLKRFFVGTFSGGKKSLYTLSRKGASLIGTAEAGLQRPRDTVLVGDRFVDHQLRINAVYLTVKFRPIPLPGVTCAGWRAFNGPLTASVSLIPDGYFELATAARTIGTFLEVDLGTETLTIWKKKVEAYLSYAISGAFQSQFLRPQFRVLVATTSEQRLHSIRTLVARFTEKIFWISSFDLIEREGFWGPVWFRPQSREPQPLLGSLP
jgi:hypothetical protein